MLASNPQETPKQPQDTIRIKIDTIGGNRLPLVEYKYVPDTLFEKQQKLDVAELDRLIEKKKKKQCP